MGEENSYKAIASDPEESNDEEENHQESKETNDEEEKHREPKEINLQVFFKKHYWEASTNSERQQINRNIETFITLRALNKKALFTLLKKDREKIDKGYAHQSDKSCRRAEQRAVQSMSGSAPGDA